MGGRLGRGRLVGDHLDRHPRSRSWCGDGAFGTPHAPTPGVCPGTSEVAWHDLTVEFADGRFAGYRDRATGARSAPRLETAVGATLGMTFARTRALYAPGDVTMAHGGAIVVAGTRTADRLFLGFFDDLPTTRLAEIKGGHPCGDV